MSKYPDPGLDAPQPAAKSSLEPKEGSDLEAGKRGADGTEKPPTSQSDPGKAAQVDQAGKLPQQPPSTTEELKARLAALEKAAIENTEDDEEIGQLEQRLAELRQQAEAAHNKSGIDSKDGRSQIKYQATNPMPAANSVAGYYQARPAAESYGKTTNRHLPKKRLSLPQTIALIFLVIFVVGVGISLLGYVLTSTSTSSSPFTFAGGSLPSCVSDDAKFPEVTDYLNALWATWGGYPTSEQISQVEAAYANLPACVQQYIAPYYKATIPELEYQLKYNEDTFNHADTSSDTNMLNYYYNQQAAASGLEGDLARAAGWHHVLPPNSP